MTSSNHAEDGPRPWWQLLFFGLFLGAALALSLLSQGRSRLTHPIEIRVEGDTSEKRLLAGVTHGEIAVEAAYLEKRWETGPFEGFRSKKLPYSGIVLIGRPAALERVTRVTVRMTTHTTVFDQQQFQSAWTRWQGQLPIGTPPEWEARRFQSPLSRGESYVAVNYEGNAALAEYVLFSPIFVIYTSVFVFALLFRAIIGYRVVVARNWVPVLIDVRTMPEVAAARTWLWLLAGAGVLIAAGVLLEQQHPYYFTQDDNFSQFLPTILYGCDSLSAGVFPSWNPHQYMGAPIAEIGTYALTYPGTYLSYGTGAYVLGDRNATLEVFCWLHLLLGYVAIFWLGRLLALAAPLASAFSLCQVLSGFALVAGRSWYYMTPVYLWVPLLIVALLHLRNHAPTMRWTMATGLIIGLFFHAGNAQMWAYGVGLAGLFVVWSCLNQSMPWQRILQIIPAGLVGLGIAAVLLVPQFAATRELQRTGGEGWDIGEGVFALFAPYPTPMVMAPSSQGPPEDPKYLGTLYYAGSVFTIAWVAGLVVVGIWRGAGRFFLRDPWNGLAAVAFLLTLGSIAGLWTVQAYLPILNRFNHSVKFLPFFHLFSCAVGAMLVSRAIGLLPRPRVWQGVTFSVVAGLLLYHAFWARLAFFVWSEHTYPALPAELSDLKGTPTHPVRILPLSLVRSSSFDHVVGLQHHFPTIFGISAIGGYDPLIEQDARYGLVLKELQTDPRSTIRKRGVTHLVLHREAADALQNRDWAWDDWRWQPRSFNQLVTDCEHATSVMQTESVRVFAVKDTTPLAYPANRASQALPVRLVWSGVDVDVSRLAEENDVVLNYLWRPGTRAYADGTLVPARADGDQHIRVLIRTGTKNLELRYESPWSTGFLLGGVLVAAGLLGWFALNAASKRWRVSDNSERT